MSKMTRRDFIKMLTADLAAVGLGSVVPAVKEVKKPDPSGDIIGKDAILYVCGDPHLGWQHVGAAWDGEEWQCYGDVERIEIPDPEHIGCFKIVSTIVGSQEEDDGCTI